MDPRDLPEPDRVEGAAARPVRVWRAGAGLAPPPAGQEPVAAEVPVAMEFNGVSHAVMLATPEDLEDFALGFALTEGIVDEAVQVRGVDLCDDRQGDKSPDRSGEAAGITLRIEIASSCFARLKERRRQLSGRSGCGLCGIDSLSQVMGPVRAVPAGGLRVAPHAVLAAMAGLHARQPLMARTGATHAAAWADASGQVLLVREDIGRHNALDKLIGALLRTREPGAGLGVGLGGGGFALVTSRASFELVNKSALAGIGLLAAVSGPTTLAVDRAAACGITLAGYARGDGMAVYHDAGHIDWAAPATR